MNWQLIVQTINSSSQAQNVNIMTFNGNELAAIIKMAVSMAAADGRFDDEEKKSIFEELLDFGVRPNDQAVLTIAARDMEASEAFATIARMTDLQKKYVTGFLAVIMVSDGQVDESEVKMWQLISALAGLPTMTISEALDFWRNH